MNYLLLLILGLLPSIIWLLFYLRKDKHPESAKMVLKIFFYGMLSSVPAAFIGWGFYQLKKWDMSNTWILLLNMFIVVGLTEEVFKYLVVRLKVLRDPEFDEPLDAMLYMIIAGLGFAALENILLFLSPRVFFLPLGETLSLAGFRWISATFLHALSSGILGYFLALSFLRTEKRKKLLFYGFFWAVFLHGFYDFVIIKFEGGNGLILLLIIFLTGFALTVSLGFKNLKKIKSVCEI